MARPWTRLALLIGAWVASRVALVAATIAFTSQFLPDVYLYATWSTILQSGAFPQGDPYWQYPPGAGPLFALAALVPPDPVLGFVVLAVVADLAILAMLTWAAVRGDHDPTWWGPWAWIVGGLAVGPIMLARFDLFPSVFAVAAILLAARPVLSGAAAAVGALLKVWPALMLIAISRRSLPKAIVAAVVTVGVLTLALMAWAEGSVSFLGEQRDRGLQIEGSAALPYLLAGAVGIEPGVTLRYGAFEVTGPGAVTLGTALTLAGLAVMAVIGVLRLLGRLEDVAPGDVALTVVLVSVATSRVFSPQYGVWLVAVAVAAGADPRSRLRRVAVLVMAMSALTQILFPWIYGSLLDAMPHAVLVQTLRLAMLWLALAASLAVVVCPSRCDRWAIVRRLVRSR